MKKVFFIAVAMIVAMSANAQFSNGGNSSDEIKNFNEVYFQYGPHSLSADGHTESGYNGFTLGYNKAISIMSTAPLYFKVGGNIRFNTYSKDQGKYEYKFKTFAVNVPLSIAYDFNIPNSDFTIEPYAGLNFDVYAWGENKYTDSHDSETEDIFSGDDAPSRFQLGWHIGANVAFRQVFLGFQYGTDFTEFGEKCHFNKPEIRLGYRF
ncbi:MAG: outer membrane beta-barrel protein [Prevotella sp.]|nr:outer membrane beta-barrel protein [Candidatus Equicola stercoris]